MLPRTRYVVDGPKTLPEMTWPEVAAAREGTDLVLFGIGACEAHGRHLPLGVDTIAGIDGLRRIAAALEAQGIAAVPGPTIPFGVSPDYMSFPGTITLRPSTLLTVLREVCGCLAQHGFRKIVLFLTHDGNLGIMQAAAQEVTGDGLARVLVLNPLPVVRERYSEILRSKGREGHAGEGETERFLVSQPELAHLDRAVVWQPERAPSTPWDVPIHFGGAVFDPPLDLRAHAPDGSICDPALATPETGEKLWSIITEFSCQMIRRHLVDA